MAAPAPLEFLDPCLRAICDAYLGATKTPGASIAVVVGDRGYHYAYGVKSIETREPVTAQTGFNIGSCSKAFTSATVASLVADGLASWDDPITKYVPEFQLQDPWVTAHATLRDLSGNRLGLPRVGLVEYGMDPEVPATEILAALRHTQPQHPFRGRFTYVNPGHTANALAAGRITGQGFLATLRERILQPLGMSGTSGGVAARDELADQAAWHATMDGAAVPIDAVHSDGYLGAGGIVVSGADALQWLRFHLNGGSVDGRQVMARDALAELHHPQVIKVDDGTMPRLPGARMEAYALGWAVADLDGHALLFHGGSDFGIAAMTVLLPEAGIGVAVYTNFVVGGDAATAFGLAGTLLGLPSRDWAAWASGMRPSSTSAAAAVPESEGSPSGQAEYAGLYSHPADGDLSIERSGDRWQGRVVRGYRMDFDLEPCGTHRFFVRFRQPEWRGMASLWLEPPQLVFDVGNERAHRATLAAQVVGRAFDRVS